VSERRIVRTYYALAGVYTLAASLIWAINTLFLLDAGLDIGEVFVANAAFSVGMVVFEIPTGVVADTLGRRVSYLLSVGVLAGTTVLYLLVAAADGGVVAFSVVSVLMGLGFTLYSGALEAWLVDALGAVGADDSLDHVFARGAQWTAAAMLVGTVGGGVLGQVDLALPFVARTVVLVLLAGVAAGTMRDIGFEPIRLRVGELPAAMVGQARTGITFGWGNRGLRMITLAGVVRSGFLFWGFYASQPYFLSLLGEDAVWVVGVTTAALSASTMAGNQIVEWATRQCGQRTTLLLWGSATVSLAGVIMGLADTFWLAVGAYLLLGAALGVIDPVRQTYLHRVTPTEVRATVVSWDAMVGSVGGAGGQLTLGAVGNAHGLSTGYVVGGLASLVALPLLLVTRRIGGPGDDIEGRGPVEGPCAGAGLPRAVGVESQPRPETATA
jgi:MFS family permease